MRQNSAKSKVIHLVGGARPNFMKIAPLYRRMSQDSRFKPVLVHTGQHFDPQMADQFFAEFELPKPDIYLGVGMGSPGEQTGRVMALYEMELLKAEHAPDLVVVVGDVNSTLACAVTTKRRGLLLAHLEAGLRSFDPIQPEEINRKVADVLADIHWTPSPDADENLRKEGHSISIRRVGNIMIDSLVMMQERIGASQIRSSLDLSEGGYIVATLHRPANVDDQQSLRAILQAMRTLSDKIPVVFPLHPRTRKRIQEFGLGSLLECSGLRVADPMGYTDFMALVLGSRFVLTDSGGVQEETSFGGIPCFTLRKETERPITVTQGTNSLVTLSDLPDLFERAGRLDRRNFPPPIEFWDGRTSDRILAHLQELFAL